MSAVSSKLKTKLPLLLSLVGFEVV